MDTETIIIFVVGVIAVGTGIAVSQIASRDLRFAMGSAYGCQTGTWNATMGIDQPAVAGNDCADVTNENYCCITYNTTSGCCNNTGILAENQNSLLDTESALSLSQPSVIIMAAGFIITLLLVAFSVM